MKYIGLMIVKKTDVMGIDNVCVGVSLVVRILYVLWRCKPEICGDKPWFRQVSLKCNETLPFLKRRWAKWLVPVHEPSADRASHQIRQLIRPATVKAYEIGKNGLGR